MAESSISPGRAGALPRGAPLVFTGLILVLILASLDQNILNTALPRIAGELGGLSRLSWIVTAFLLTSVLSTPLYGKLSDVYGRRPVLIGSISIFLLGSMLCGMAQSLGQLVAFRALQGLGAGGLITLAQTAIGDLVGVRQRGRYQGYFTGAFAISSVIGPLVGGWITEHFSWRWVFYVNLPVGALALALILLALQPQAPAVKPRIDYAGALLLAAATTGLLLTLSLGGAAYAWGSWQILALAGGAALSVGLYVRRRDKAAEPILDLRMFRTPAFAVGVLCSTLMSFAMMGTMLFVPLYFQLVMGMDPVSAGMMLLPQVVAMMISAIVGGRMVSRRGRYKLFLSVALALESASLIGLALAAALGANAAVFGVCLAIKGLGMGIGLPNATTAVQNAVPHAAIGVATSTMTFLRSLGGALGVAIAGNVMAARLPVAGGVDAAEVSNQLLRAASTVSPELLEATRAAYQHAIAASMVMGGVAMSIAFLICVFALPSETLRERDLDPAELP